MLVVGEIVRGLGRSEVEGVGGGVEGVGDELLEVVEGEGGVVYNVRRHDMEMI